MIHFQANAVHTSAAESIALQIRILIEPGFRGFEFNGNPFAMVDDMLEVVWCQKIIRAI